MANPKDNAELLWNIIKSRSKDVGVGAGVGALTGVSAGALRRLINPVEVTPLPQEEEEEFIIDDAAPEKVAALDVRKANLLHLLGAAGGVGLGMKGYNYGSDKLRERDLDKQIGDQKAELQELMLEEQRLAKTAENVLTRPVVDLLADAVGKFNQVSGQSQSAAAHYAMWPAISAALGTQQGYERATAGDPDRARVAALKDSLRRRIGEDGGEGRQSPILLKLKV